ncbi:MAG: PQQ-binding-like beta-propeller repeat protein [Bacteroidota bacterium]
MKERKLIFWKLRFGSMLKGFLIIVMIVTHIVVVEAQDTQWRGLSRDGKYPDRGLLKEWPKGGPELILQKEGLGNGYSTPILYEGMVYISGRRDSVDVVTKLDLQGNIQWETTYGLAWDKSFQETRSTPTIENGYLYIMGGLGTVVCMDTESGNIVWKRNTHEEFEGEFHRWGIAESLLLVGDKVISSPVGEKASVVALDKKDGSLLWKTKSLGGHRAYVSPLHINHNGREMILLVSIENLFAVDPESGDLIWSFDIMTDFTVEGRHISTNTPLYQEGSVFLTSGYNADALMLTLSPDGSEIELKWHDATLDTHHGGVVLVDGYLYGSNWLNNGNGNWVCQEWETGKVMYEEKWHNKGSIIFADGLLYVYEEKRGHVGLVEPTTEGFRVISSFKIEGGAGPHWAHMSIYDKMLFVRHGKVLFIYDIEGS